MIRHCDDPEAWERVLENSLLPEDDIPYDRELALKFYGDDGQETINLKTPVHVLFPDNSFIQYPSVPSCAKAYNLSIDELTQWITSRRKHTMGYRFKAGRPRKFKYWVVYDGGSVDKYDDVDKLARAFRTTPQTINNWTTKRRFFTSGKGRGFKFLKVKE